MTLTENEEETGFLVARADWSVDEPSLRAIRHKVFVEEQGVPDEIEWDGQDTDSAHFLAYDMQGSAIATIRMLDDGHIGRLAVLPEWRNQGVGSSLLLAAIELADEHGLEKVFIHAQADSATFYHIHGFMNEGDLFEEAGIPHIRMSRYCGEL